MAMQTSGPTVYFVVDSDTQGVDYMGWGYDHAAAVYELTDMIGRGYEVELRSYDLMDVPDNLAMLGRFGSYDLITDDQLGTVGN